jgi:ERF superfamily
MQRASETIGALAGALAKAQTELVNPEKSLVATIGEEGARGREQTFRYAPLSSGLEIVRKVLGQHEIATVRTTSIDQAAGLINLTTVLAHVSGEWIASDWPVCPVTDTVSPRRMGAALTYARRYALFAPVGIAGEDDLDAPDLQTAVSESGPKTEQPKATGRGGFTERAQATTSPRPGLVTSGRGGKLWPKLTEATLGLHASAKLRERLIAGINSLGSSEQVAEWVRQSLPEKNRLRASHATHVEAVFEAKLAQLTAFGGSEVDVREASLVERSAAQTLEADPQSDDSTDPTRQTTIDKSALAFPEPRRIRDRHHIRLVMGRPCLVCGRLPSDPHHLRFAQSRALSRRVSDEFTVPLCRGHHRALHRHGDEAAWWGRLGIDVLEIARALWLESHPLPVARTAGSEALSVHASQPTGSMSGELA